MINLLLANDCKLNCKYCYQKNKHDKKKMKVEFLKEILLKEKNKRIHLFGGEPFNNKECMIFISENIKNADIKITTNVLETDIEILKKMAKNNSLKHLKLSLGVLNSDDRYDKENQKKIFKKVIDIVNSLKNFKDIKIEFHFVFMKKDFDLMFENYKFFSEIIIKTKRYCLISYCLNVDEKKDENDLKKVFINYKKILDYDFEHFNNVMFYSFKPRKYFFCKGENDTTYDINKSFKGCPVSIYEKPNNMEEECLLCKNKFCSSCFLNTNYNCEYYKKLEIFIEKEVWNVK